MKKYVVIIITVLFFGVSFSSNVEAVVCQNKTAIVYSNGMFNDKIDAEKGLTKLEKKLRGFPQASSLLVELEFYLAYASGGSKYVPQVASEHWVMKLLNLALASPNAAGQIGEVVLQKIFQDDLSAFIRWIAGLQSAGSTLQNIMNQLASGANAASYVYTPELNAQLVTYKTLLNSGSRVVIVSHSQGNFYANAAYSELILANPAWANSIGNVQVSSPASANLAGKIGNNEPQITVNEDVVMNFVQSISLGQSMPRKPSGGGWSPNMQIPNAFSVRNKATLGHNFVKWYLAGTYTRDFIMKGIVDTLNGVGAYAGLQYPTTCVQPTPIFQTSLYLDSPYPSVIVSPSYKVVWRGVDYTRKLFYKVTLDGGTVPWLETVVTDAYGNKTRAVFYDTAGTILNGVGYGNKMLVTSTGYSLFENGSFNWSLNGAKIDVKVSGSIVSDPIVSSYNNGTKFGGILIRSDWSRITRIGTSYRYEWATHLLRGGSYWSWLPWTEERETRLWEINDGVGVTQTWSSGWGLWLSHLGNSNYVIGTGFPTPLISGSLAERGMHAGAAVLRDGTLAGLDGPMIVTIPRASSFIIQKVQDPGGLFSYPGYFVRKPAIMLKAAVVEPNANGYPVVSQVAGLVATGLFKSSWQLFALYNNNPGILRSSRPFAVQSLYTDSVNLSSTDVWWLLSRAPLANPMLPDPR